METFYCGGHKEYLPREKFFEASLKCGETRCRKCSNKERTKRRREDPMRWLQFKMYRTEHRLQSKDAYPTIETVQEIFERYEGRSVLGDEEGGELCIVRIDSDLPLSDHPLNAALVTSKQAQSLPRKREKRIMAFPKNIRDQVK